MIDITYKNTPKKIRNISNFIGKVQGITLSNDDKTAFVAEINH